MTTVEIFGFSPSTYTRTARMTCIEKGVTHVLSPLAFREESHRLLHPFLKMPALRHGDRTLFETLAICDYIDSAFDGPALKPSDAWQRASMFGWITAQVDYLYPAVVHPLLADAPPSADQLASARERLQVFEGALNNAAFLAGDELSLADLFLAPMIEFAQRLEQGQTLLDGMPGLAAWRARMSKRPSHEETEG